MRRLHRLAIALLLATSPAAAETPAPAVVFDVGGVFDAGFNELIWQGAERFTVETGIPYVAAERHDDAARDAALERFAAEGRSPIIAAGTALAPRVAEVAATYPHLDFVIIDTVVDAPNVQSIVFREQEGAFLAGMLAAMASKTGTLGFIGGMDIPVIRAFACGYRQGARHVDPDIVILETTAGTTGEAWSNPMLGGELARQLVDQGADVVFPAAGGTGLGVLEAMAAAGLLGIGVDSNQNGLWPGHVLTSMEKRVDVATYGALMAALDGSWQPGVVDLGLAEGAIALAFDEHNAPLVSEAMAEAVAEAEAAIVDGGLAVHDWRTDESCPE